MNEWTKSRFDVVVKSYGRNKNRDDEIKKNQGKANNNPSYRCVAIKKNFRLSKWRTHQKFSNKITIEILKFEILFPIYC